MKTINVKNTHAIREHLKAIGFGYVEYQDRLEIHLTPRPSLPGNDINKWLAALGLSKSDLA